MFLSVYWFHIYHGILLDFIFNCFCVHCKWLLKSHLMQLTDLNLLKLYVLIFFNAAVSYFTMEPYHMLCTVRPLLYKGLFSIVSFSNIIMQNVAIIYYFVDRARVFNKSVSFCIMLKKETFKFVYIFCC